MEMLIELYENRIKLFINNAFIAFSRQKMSLNEKRELTIHAAALSITVIGCDI